MIRGGIDWLFKAAVLIVAALLLWGVLSWVSAHPKTAADNVTTVSDKGKDAGAGFAEFISHLLDGGDNHPAKSK